MRRLATPDYDVLAELGYSGIEEKTYAFDHPDVIRWTAYFEGEAARRRIFSRFESEHPQPSFAKAEIVGTQWFRFSDFMPWLLCQAAALMPTNELRHYVIQTAFEELGMRNVNEIHPELFWRTVEAAGVAPSARVRLADSRAVSESLDFLRQCLTNASSDFVLGLLLGLEIPARENIETVFESLAYTVEVRERLEDTRFFKLHRQIEIEHVRLNVANFIRFCPGEESRQRFLAGFQKGLDFWELYWRALSELISAYEVHNHAS